MDNATTISRLQFAFTAGFHYLFPALTMGLAFLLVILKTLYLRTKHEDYNIAARFWTRIFAVTFVIGVVTGIPLEFQFGTNWALFSTAVGDVIAQTLAMEGAFAFFLESAFLGVLLFGERRFGQRLHWFAAVMVWIGTWASGYFIIASNAWMQHPVGYRLRADGGVEIANYWEVLLNPWILGQYTHTMVGAVITGSFAMAGLGAYYLLMNREEHAAYGRMFVRIGVIVGFIASLLAIFPTGDLVGSQVTTHQPAKLAAMEGLFESEEGAGIALVGQPDMEQRRLDNPIVIPRILSFLTYRRWGAEVKGLNEIPESEWPDNVPLLYYAYHNMAGLGTIFAGSTSLAAFLLWRRRLYHTRPVLWLLLLLVPFPWIANTAGWFTAETGRQPWLAYGLIRTADGSSPTITSGTVLFTLVGFMGMYALMGMLYLIITLHQVQQGPGAEHDEDHEQEESLGLTAAPAD